MGLDDLTEIITPRQRKKLRKLVDFEFSKHPVYNLNDSRLAFLNRFVQERARRLLV